VAKILIAGDAGAKNVITNIIRSARTYLCLYGSRQVAASCSGSDFCRAMLCVSAAFAAMKQCYVQYNYGVIACRKVRSCASIFNFFCEPP